MAITADDGRIHETDFPEYKVARVMWKVIPPFIIVLGTLGNLATILVMSRMKDDNSSQNVILLVLAVSDLGVLYSGLFDDWLLAALHVYVPGLYTVPCKLKHWAMYACTTCSAWLVTTVTVQRAMAVLWPHRMRSMCTVRRTWVVIAVVVVTACSVHLHIMVGFHLSRKKLCFPSAKYSYFYFMIWPSVDMCITCFLPSTCLIACDVILSWTLFKSASVSSTAAPATPNVSDAHSGDSRKRNAVKVTVMILALSCTFFILMLPVYVYLIWTIHWYVYTPKTEALNIFFHCLTSLMWCSNSAVNFLLYCITGARFRKEFVKLLRCGSQV